MMKKTVLLVISYCIYISAFSQNVDWVNAPVNPIPNNSDLQYKNVQGNVFQLWLNRYDRDGKRINSIGHETIKDNLGRVTQYNTSYGTSYHYTYDSRGNLIEEKSDTHVNTYEYDANNRISKLTYVNLRDNDTRSTNYSYQKSGAIVKVTELETSFSGELYETERLFKNGLEIERKTKGYPTTLFEYEFDEKGNWIKQNKIDATTNKIKISTYDNQPVKPTIRDIIYYDEYETMPTNSIAVIEDLSKGTSIDKKLLAPNIYIAGKKLSLYAFERFTNDFIFYGPNRTTYFIVRGAYNSNNTDGQRLQVEQLISGAENILLVDKNYVQIVEQGKSSETGSDWKTINYKEHLKCYVSTNKSKGRTYAFENLPQSFTDRVEAFSGKAINGIWHTPTQNKKYTFLLDDGNVITDGISLAGYLSTNNDLVFSEDGKPKYILTNFDNAIDYQFSKVRLFNPATDKIVTQKMTASTAETTTAEQAAEKVYPIDHITATFNGNTPLFVRYLDEENLHFYQNKQRINAPIKYEIIASLDDSREIIYCSYTEEKFYYCATNLKDMSPNKIYPLISSVNANYVYAYGNGNGNDGIQTLNYNGKVLEESEYELFNTAGYYYVVRIKANNNTYIFNRTALQKNNKAISSSVSLGKGILMHMKNYVMFFELDQPTDYNNWKIKTENNETFLYNEQLNKRYDVSDKEFNCGVFFCFYCIFK